MSEQRKVDLSRFTCPWWTIGRGQAVVTLWRLVGQPLCRWLPSETLGDLFFNRLRIAILRFFGAAIGEGVIIRNTCQIHYPWKLEIGNHVWIGYGVNLYNLVPITLCSHVCISQNAYLCTGSHDASDPFMGLIVGEITVEEGAWVGANSFIHPGVVIDQEAVVAAGSVVVKDVPMRSIVGGNPAQIIKSRQFRDLTSGEGGGFKQTGNLVSPAELSQRGNLPIK